MPKLNPKVAMEAEAVILIKTVTDIEEDEENFEICERFVLSNLFYHKFLDPDENKINRSITGIHQKFLIHAQPDKAGALMSLVEKYKDGDVWQEHHEQYDIKYRLLSFLLNLASSPLNTEYCPADNTPEEEKGSVDWLAVLREGEATLEPLGDEEELSDWSDNDSDISEELMNNNNQCDLPVIVTPSNVSTIDRPGPDPATWFSENIQFPYWEREQSLPSNSSCLDSGLANIVENLQEEGGKLGVRTRKLSEYQVLREVLWMLRSPVESPLFQYRNGEFVVTTLVTIPSLTDGAMTRLLQDALQAINNVHVLKIFLRDKDDCTKSIPKTFEAYRSGVDVFLEAFWCQLYRVEQDVLKQDDTCTILSVLDTLKPWFIKIHKFKSVHMLATGGFANNENWYISIKVLSVLYNALLSNILPGLMPFLLDIFLRSIEPYFNIIHIWLTEGRLEDWCDEFIFYKDKDPLEEGDDFWNNVFRSYEFKSRLSAENIVPLRLLDELDQKIFVSGKSIEILSRLDHLLNRSVRVEFDEENNSRILFIDFLENLQSQLPRKAIEEDTPALAPVQGSEVSPEYGDIVKSADDPYLALAFMEVFKQVETFKHRSPTAVPQPPGLLLTNNTVDSLLPLEPLLKRSLSPTITSHYTRACSTLVTMFMEDLQLESVLSRARKVFFMEAGDLLHDFCTQLFQLLDRGDSLETGDSASLTLLLQDCLGARYPSWCDQFSCSYTPPQQYSLTLSLDCLAIQMTVPWPLTFLLSQANLDTYNKIFVFLARVKRSLWSLQSVRLSRLAELEDSMEGQADLSFGQSIQDSSLPLGAKQHRLQLLRSWLLYFTTTMHGYFMSRVVHSTELELQEKLKTATDLDMILSTHQEYLQRIYDRCFLHPSASMLREAVMMVLDIGQELQQATISNLPIHTRTLTTWEEKYGKCHKFLATTLQAMTVKRKLPHLEGLAIALLHSCPV